MDKTEKFQLIQVQVANCLHQRQFGDHLQEKRKPVSENVEWVWKGAWMVAKLRRQQSGLINHICPREETAQQLTLLMEHSGECAALWSDHFF